MCDCYKEEEVGFCTCEQTSGVVKGTCIGCGKITLEQATKDFTEVIMRIEQRKKEGSADEP